MNSLRSQIVTLNAISMCSNIECYTKLLPLQGVLLIASVPRVLPWATSFWAFSPFLNHLQCSILKKKSQYPADGAEYCDFTFLLYKSFLFDAFFYRLQYIVENHYIVQIITES